ncbi:MAG: class I SAM-dependent methyltransferase, partial [Thermoplasmata archaeon]|nr:class I SAM-dependent methyltransferase [Thermoplasmata archaeon]
ESDMLTGRVEGRFLKLIVKISGAKNVLECGTYTGYSALSMAEALPEDGRVITCERDPERRAVAEEYFSKSPHGKKIEIRFGDALESLKNEDSPLDMIFLDADKDRYPEYYEEAVNKLRSGGIIVIDNTLWEGEVLEPKTDSAKAIAEMNDRIAEDSRIENVLLTVRDGIQLITKK